MTWKNLEAIWIKFDVSRSCLPVYLGSEAFNKVWAPGLCWARPCMYLHLASAYNDSTNARCGRSVRTALAPPWSRRMLYCRSGDYDIIVSSWFSHHCISFRRLRWCKSCYPVSWAIFRNHQRVPPMYRRSWTSSVRMVGHWSKKVRESNVTPTCRTSDIDLIRTY